MVWENPQKGVKKVVLFDGVCGMCNRSVNLLMSIDARNLLVLPFRENLLLRKPKRMLMILIPFYFSMTVRYTKGQRPFFVFLVNWWVWSIARIFLLVPSVVRDAVYSRIANNRYKWFGKSDACRLPTKEEREKFLD